ncbi:MAG: CoA pyrophosphatase [Acidobacteriota bacterium]|nr:CoA pyrophosphatase [Acidobacteriota bacterium]
MPEPDAAVAILRTTGPDSAILLMRRTERADDAWSGHWSLPGGRRDASDPDPLHTALRELHEECGIRLSRGQMSAALPPAIARRSAGPFLLVAPFVFEVETPPATAPDAREVAGTVWIPHSTLCDPARHSLQPVPGMPPEMLFPTIALPVVPLWGFTYRLLADWLEVSPRDRAACGFDVARMSLDFLLSHGLSLERSWQPAHSEGAAGPPARVAQVRGPIPVDALRAYLSAPGAHAAKVNRIEARPARIRIHGLAFEEYVIEAAG